MKRTWKIITQITNVNKRFTTTFPTIIKHEKHIDNTAKNPENSNEFLRSLVKILKIKSFILRDKIHENVIIENEKTQRVEK